MTLTAPTLESLTLSVTHEIHVRASLDATFDALLEQMGPANETPDGKPLPMTIEARGPLVPRSGTRQRSFLGTCAGRQPTRIARDHRAAFHVVAGRIERAVPLEGK